MFMLFWPWFFYSKRTDAIIESLNTLKPGFHVVAVANLSKVLKIGSYILSYEFHFIIIQGIPKKYPPLKSHLLF